MTLRTRTPPRLTGRATAAGTTRYQSRFADELAEDFYRPLTGGARVSSIGLGTYLGECDDADDARYSAAITRALSRGINLLDSAINYRCQRSERAVGAALREAVGANIVRRDEVVVCTKGGFIPLDGAPPATREEYRALLQREYYDAGVMSPSDVVAGGHCITPRFLAHQLQRSLANLGLQTIDLYYVHNPEQQLSVTEPGRFRDRIRDAFAVLEERVRAGDIGGYGCATWTGLRVPAGSRGHLSLRELAEAATEVGGTSHHFRAVQLPLNLAMSEAVRTPTQLTARGTLVPVVEAATELGISIVASASLMQAQLATGLPAALRETFPNLRTDAQRAIAFVRALPVAAALVGMKNAAHVDENIEAGQ